ncbi:carbohydrate sulfotransferase 14-like [Haliotis asinina]|uniref:carbohydrate sulfotransferase 14-like n=1 Tax=Haliotis asinina TaxID=109174 RepID=UPI003531AD64
MKRIRLRMAIAAIFTMPLAIYIIYDGLFLLKRSKTIMSTGTHSTVTEVLPFQGGISIEKKCKEMGLTSDHAKRAYHKIIVDHQYKVLYCEIPKVATTNWKRVFLMLSSKMSPSLKLNMKPGDIHHRYEKYTTFLSALQPVEIDEVLKTYYKFVFVREPFERLLSAYLNKLVASREGMFASFGRSIVKKYRNNSRNKDPHPSFSEFLEYVVKTNTLTLNEHWQLQEDLCQVCNIKYDLIGKYEELQTTAQAILDHIGAPSSVAFPQRSDWYRNEKTNNLLRHYYQDVPPSLLQQVWRKFYPDFQLFNYTVPSAITNPTKSWK